MTLRFETLEFTRDVAAAPAVLWHAWTSPGVRALWSSPDPAVTVEYLEADTRIGGREVSLCKVAGQPDIRCEIGWLALEASRHSVNSEVILREGATLSAALVSAQIEAQGAGSRLRLTVQLASLAEDMAQGYRDGFGAGLDNLVAEAEAREARTMVLERLIAAPVATVWRAWTDPAALPLWWGPDGFSCRTQRIDLREGGEWVFDMIAPDGTVFPNHHRYTRHAPPSQIDYSLHWGENGPQHAEASARFETAGAQTRVTLRMTFTDPAEYETAKGFGAVELGLQTLGKLARHIGAA